MGKVKGEKRRTLFAFHCPTEAGYSLMEMNSHGNENHCGCSHSVSEYFFTKLFDERIVFRRVGNENMAGHETSKKICSTSP
jgi:hypothetical protein